MKMTLEQFYTYQEQTFDAFCKSVIHNESIDAFRELSYRREHEIGFSALENHELFELASQNYERYRKTYSVLGYVVEVGDPGLGEILQYIPSQLRDIVLLSYFLGYTDLEIGKMLHTNRNTVHYRRMAALRRLRELLKGLDHG